MPRSRPRWLFACRHLHRSCRFVADTATRAQLVEALTSHCRAVHGATFPVTHADEAVMLRFRPHAG